MSQIAVLLAALCDNEKLVAWLSVDEVDEVVKDTEQTDHWKFAWQNDPVSWRPPAFTQTRVGGRDFGLRLWYFLERLLFFLCNHTSTTTFLKTVVIASIVERASKSPYKHRKSYTALYPPFLQKQRPPHRHNVCCVFIGREGTRQSCSLYRSIQVRDHIRVSGTVTPWYTSRAADRGGQRLTALDLEWKLTYVGSATS